MVPGSQPGSPSRLKKNAIWTWTPLHVPVECAEAKLRYRSDPVPARVEPTAAGFRLELQEPSYGVAPGQGAVLYDSDGVVVGAGTIRTAA